jgi:hypothetical protein
MQRPPGRTLGGAVYRRPRRLEPIWKSAGPLGNPAAGALFRRGSAAPPSGHCRRSERAGPRRSRAWAGGDRDPSRTIWRDGRTGKRDRRLHSGRMCRRRAGQPQSGKSDGPSMQMPADSRPFDGKCISAGGCSSGSRFSASGFSRSRGRATDGMACGVITIKPHPIVWTTSMDVLVVLASAVVGFALGYLARSLVSRRRRRKARMRR